MKTCSIARLLKNNPYPGRGILLGRSEDGKNAVIAYFIMGRSENSRNRIFVETEDGIQTEPCDVSKVKDPTYIIYHPVRALGNDTIVTNGDQTDTVWEGLKKGIDFQDSLKTREFEHDAPHYTPRISGIVTCEGGELEYRLSILKSNAHDPESCLRYTFDYNNPKAGEGHFISTYKEDWEPLPSFEGEPVRVAVEGDLMQFSDLLWNSLNSENKISLFVRFIDIATGKADTRIINKYTR